MNMVKVKLNIMPYFYVFKFMRIKYINHTPSKYLILSVLILFFKTNANKAKQQDIKQITTIMEASTMEQGVELLNLRDKLAKTHIKLLGDLICFWSEEDSLC